MSELKCQSSTCDQLATVHLTRANERQVSNVSHFCNSHAKLHFDDWYRSTSKVGPKNPVKLRNSIGFDIDFLFCDELQDRPWGRHYVQLVEKGGQRQISFVIGAEVCSALNFHLHRSHAPRPLTYQSMATAISALGGQLQYVEIDKFFPTQHIYEAKLHIRQMNTDVVVDMRPSDALVLAVICDVPIVVSESVLALMAQGQQ